MDIFQLALNGIGAVADALSLAPGSAKPVEIEKQKVKAAVTKTTAPASSQAATAHQSADQQPQAPALTEAERIAQERLADIAETRQQQDQQLGQQQGSRLNR